MRALVTALFLIAAPAGAECVGQNVFDTMSAGERARIEMAANAVPFSKGNFWTATKGEARITLVGTYHLNDPRHDQTIKGIANLIDEASTVLVEGGPQEEAALKQRMRRDATVLVLQDDSLIRHMPPEDWALLSEALIKRGTAPVMAARMQPWFIIAVLGIPPCKLAEMTTPNGLDQRIIARAITSGITLRALEPYDTVIRLFDGIPFQDQISMIRSSLAIEDRADDYAVTLADAYFDGEARLIWELMRAEAASLPGYTPEKIDAEFAMLEEALMSARNRDWIPVIEDAAADGPVVAAFGALHLPGNDGVLALLDRAGWTLKPLTMTP